MCVCVYLDAPGGCVGHRGVCRCGAAQRTVGMKHSGAHCIHSSIRNTHCRQTQTLISCCYQASKRSAFRLCPISTRYHMKHFSPYEKLSTHTHSCSVTDRIDCCLSCGVCFDLSMHHRSEVFNTSHFE